jgi:hypothetical protein
VSRRAVAAALIGLVILVCAWPLAAFSMKHYLPEVDNDEVMYFLLVKVFRSQGFHGGYSFVNDRIPKSPVHFDAHGPGTVLVFSSLAPLVGWTNYSPYLANLLMFVTSWLLLAYALRRRPDNQIAVACFVLANGYFFMFLPSAMQESFHISVAIAAAALWYVAVERDQPIAWLGLGVLLFAASLVRYSWAVVIPCAVFSFVTQRAGLRRGTARWVIAAAAALAAGAIAAVAAVKLLLWWAVPPVPSGGAAFSVPRIAEGFDASRLLANLSALVHFRMMPMFADYPKFFVVSVAILFVVLAVAAVRADSDRTRTAALYAIAILLFSSAAQLLFSEVDGYRELRLLSPAHALAGVIFFSFADLRFDAWAPGTKEIAAAAVIVLVIVNFLFAREGLERKYWSNWRYQTPAIDRDGQMVFTALAPHFDFHPDDSSFCKTVYGDSEVLADPRLIYLPDGFALSVVEPDTEGRLPQVRGKYALVKKPGPDLRQAFDWVVAFSRSSRWRRLASVEDITLFRSTVNCL